MDETNEDSWLYGTSNPDSTTTEAQVEDKIEPVAEIKIENEAEALDEMMTGDIVQKEEDVGEFEDPAQEMEEDEAATAAADTTEVDAIASAPAQNEAAGEAEQEQQQIKSPPPGSDDDDDDEDDSDDDINVVIGDIKAASSTYNIKQRGNLLTAGQVGAEKSKGAAQGGKFTVEDFEGVGTINGVAAHEFSIDSLEDKPWRKPGADITDYFNYGFNEETWRSYCERQKRFRVVESGVGLVSLTQNLNQSSDHRHNEHIQPGLLPPPSGVGMSGGPPDHQGQSQGLMPPPMSSHHHGALQRIPLSSRPPRPMNNSSSSSSGGQAKENAIQVMTAECREYSRPGQMVPNFVGPPPGDEPFFAEPEPFDYGYEPTQESQWGNNGNTGWVPTGIKELTPGPAIAAVPPGVPPPNQSMPGAPTMRGPPPNLMGAIPPNMPMGPPPPHVIPPMMMGPNVGPMRMPMMGMMPPQQHVGPPPLLQPKIEPLDEKPRSPNRRNRSRSPPHRSTSRRRSKSPSSRQRRSRSKSYKPPSRSRRSRSSSKSRKSAVRTTNRRSRSRSAPKPSHKTARTHRSRSPSESKQSSSRTKRSRRSHSRTRSKSPKTASSSSSSSSKKRSGGGEKTEK